MIAEKFVRLIDSDLTSISSISIQSGSETNDKHAADEVKKLKANLETKFAQLENSLSQKFKTLNDLLQERQTFLLAELNKCHNECQNLIDAYLVKLNGKQTVTNAASDDLFISISNLIDQLDEWLDENTFIDENKLLAYFEKLNNLIRRCTEAVSDENKATNDLILPNSSDCTIKGNGLSECYLNEEASFVLEFKNRNASFFSKASVSFLGT